MKAVWMQKYPDKFILALYLAIMCVEAYCFPEGNSTLLFSHVL